MRKGFTLIELMIVVCIVAIIAAMAIPAMMEDQAKRAASKTVIGKTFEIGGVKTMVLDYVNGKYKVVLLGPQPVQVEMTPEVVKAAYDTYTRTHVEKP